MILLIKKKGDKEGFDFEDSKIILCLEVIRLELSSLDELSDDSLGAFGCISGWSYHYYQNIYTDIHELIIYLDDEFNKLNKNEYKADIEFPVGNSRNDWCDYLCATIQNVLKESK
ncbi:MAG: hypothetical protein ACRBG0_28200 [Lewinella sp.]|uniref:hypothetical protein n=1 Tax=Lewinella sp. TaxID=2004506 RepID=UPI003D6BD446